MHYYDFLPVILFTKFLRNYPDKHYIRTLQSHHNFLQNLAKAFNNNKLLQENFAHIPLNLTLLNIILNLNKIIYAVKIYLYHLDISLLTLLLPNTIPLSPKNHINISF